MNCYSAEQKESVIQKMMPPNNIPIPRLAECCRQKGLYAEQIEVWRKACLQANADSTAQAKAQREQAKKDRKRIKTLERELRRKEKALAETAALLVLQKKAQAIWEDGEDE